VARNRSWSWPPQPNIFLRQGPGQYPRRVRNGKPVSGPAKRAAGGSNAWVAKLCFKLGATGPVYPFGPDQSKEHRDEASKIGGRTKCGGVLPSPGHGPIHAPKRALTRWSTIFAGNERPRSCLGANDYSLTSISHCDRLGHELPIMPLLPCRQRPPTGSLQDPFSWEGREIVFQAVPKSLRTTLPFSLNGGPGPGTKGTRGFFLVCGNELSVPGAF